MLGHVAQSIGGALPGAVSGAATLVGQIAGTGSSGSISGTVPAGAAFAFMELIANGGDGPASSARAGGGGGATDAIVAVTPGQAISATVTKNATHTLSLAGTQVLSCTPGGSGGASTSGPGGTGKYPGSSGSSTVPGAAGGRLAGQTITFPTAGVAGLGGGAKGGSTSTSERLGGTGGFCVTFFTSYEAALAFANSLYGGNWTP